MWSWSHFLFFGSGPFYPLGFQPHSSLPPKSLRIANLLAAGVLVLFFCPSGFSPVSSSFGGLYVLAFLLDHLGNSTVIQLLPPFNCCSAAVDNSGLPVCSNFYVVAHFSVVWHILPHPLHSMPSPLYSTCYMCSPITTEVLRGHLRELECRSLHIYLWEWEMCKYQSSIISPLFFSLVLESSYCRTMWVTGAAWSI